MSHRLYIDESGDHFRVDPTDVGKRYLALVGVAFDRDPYFEFRDQVDALKRKHLLYGDADHPPVLHREDIVNRRGPYRSLQDPDKCAAFDGDLIGLISAAQFTVFAIVIDKFEHGEKHYRYLKHPYHYCMQAMLERYCGWLNYRDRRGDVMAESRGGAENRALSEAYATVHQFGTSYLSGMDARKALTSKEVKIRAKDKNIAGLQLADLLAHPLKHDVLLSFRRPVDRVGAFAERLAATIRPKYNINRLRGKIQGYGRVLLT